MLLNILIFNFVLLPIKISANECGVVKFVEPKIAGGTAISRGEWPFIAALYYTEEAKFFCGATLISNNHVLTAAHCVQPKNVRKKLSPEDVVVLLGAYNIDSQFERGVQQRDVAEIHVHPDWKVFYEKYDADIAIFVLSSAVEFTNYIQPICIPTDDYRFDDVNGCIVGWGLAENTTLSRHEHTPRHTIATALSDSYCYTTEKFIAVYSSIRTFCGGGGGGSPNQGDSGGGFFVHSGSVWMQYGVISANLAYSNGFTQPNSFSIYTNVKMFRNWIYEMVGSLDNSESNDNKLFCYFEIQDAYRCLVLESNIIVDNGTQYFFAGTHLAGYVDQNVAQIWFSTGKFASIPNGIGNVFQHLEKFFVGHDGRNLGLERIQRSNFRDMPELKVLQLYDNYIETLDVDTLYEITNLEAFQLSNGRLKVLPENFFALNAKLRYVVFNGNQIEFLPKYLFSHNPLMQEVSFKNNQLRSISINFFDLQVVRFIDLHGNTCIDNGFDTTTTLAELQSLLSNRC